MRRPWNSVIVVAAAMVLLGTSWAVSAERRGDAASDAALERTREKVRMLDDIYKTAIVLITENYVEDENSFPAGAAAVAWFDAIKKKGWADTRLVDATGNPIDEDNAPRDRFEKNAVSHLKAGHDYYEQIVEKSGRRYLRAATPVPVVLQKCTMCHEHYKNVKPGQPIGTLSYQIEIK